MQHLAVLENAALVSSSKAGRERHFVVRTERLATAAGWMSQVAAQWEARLATLKALAQASSG